MTQIKFRAWDEQRKEMHHDFQFIRSGIQGNDWVIFTSDKQPFSSNWKDNPHFSQQLKIMQFTGLKDKNGKEVYEGDVLREKKECYEPALGVVHYMSPAFIVADKDGNTYWLGGGRAGIEQLKDTEVIGNIYENPELLK